MLSLKNRPVYLITDDSNFDFSTLYRKVEQSIQGGASIIQLREKQSSSLEFYNHALKLKELCNKHQALLIINDRLDIAQAVDADGVHLGQRDLPLVVARKILGNKKIIGISAKTTETALKAQEEGADYLGVGAVFPTSTKKDAEYISKEEFLDVRKMISIPIYAIGGINTRNAVELVNYKVDGIAVSSSILNAADPEKTTASFNNLFE
ncbi:MAG: thiamine phosphate synthase [Maledivibacter sp.]|jgi:thiamine-phosphate pyrophosphorylase|nr:thiamine phosphate synthase [Maledivibacter sp.]